MTMEYTIEKSAPWNPTLEEFRKSYDRSYLGPWWKRVLSCLPPRKTGYDTGKPYTTYTVEWWRLAFELRLRVPDRAGFFGPNIPGACWCLPWNWLRLYYEHRVAKT